MCIGYAFQLRNDTAEFEIIRRPSGSSAGHGWAAVYSRGDSRFLAGLDVPGRIFCIVSRDHRLPDEKGSKAPRATNERRTFCRERTYSKTHNALRIARIYWPHCFPRTRSGSGASGDFGPEKARSRAEDRQTAKHICFNLSRFQSLTRPTREASAAHIWTVVRRCTRTGSRGVRAF
jgi:hypothetical protein